MPSLDTLNALANEQEAEIKALKRDMARMQRDHRMVIDARDAELLRVRTQCGDVAVLYGKAMLDLEKERALRLSIEGDLWRKIDESMTLADQHARQRDSAMQERDQERWLREQAEAVTEATRGQRDGAQAVADAAVANLLKVTEQRDEFLRQRDTYMRVIDRLTANT